MTVPHRPLTDAALYRWTSLVLLAGSILVPMAALAMGAPKWVAVVIMSMPIHIMLIVTTWRRLSALGLSVGWILPMLLVIRIGPHWEGPWEITFYLTDMVSLIPIAICWFARPAGPATAVA